MGGTKPHTHSISWQRSKITTLISCYSPIRPALHLDVVCVYYVYPCRRCFHIYRGPQTILWKYWPKAPVHRDAEDGKNILQLQNHHRQMRVPYVIYADSEALNISVQGAAMNQARATLGWWHSRSCAALGTSYWSDAQTSAPSMYRGLGAAEWFLHRMLQEVANIHDSLCCPTNMIMT